MQDDISEQELIAQYKATKDQKWLGKLFTPYSSLLYGTCLKYLKNTAEAQDAVMDIYEKVSVKLLTHTVNEFRPWLYVVSKNYCFEKLRKSTRVREKENKANDVYSETVFHPDSVSKEATFVKMEECMQKLTKEQNQCIEAFYYKSMTYEKIGTQLNLSYNQVRSYIQNGRRKLKLCIEAK